MSQIKIIIKKLAEEYNYIDSLFISSGLRVQSSSIIPFPGYPLCPVPH